jgi:hypothetical protein
MMRSIPWWIPCQRIRTGPTKPRDAQDTRTWFLEELRILI